MGLTPLPRPRRSLLAVLGLGSNPSKVTPEVYIPKLATCAYCDTVSSGAARCSNCGAPATFGMRYGRFCGGIDGLPSDLASRHDEYRREMRRLL